MKFKIDENLPADICVDLRAAGHDADTVSDEGMAGAADVDVMTRVKLEGRVALTLDKGIADVRLYPPDQYPGIVLFRPQSTGRNATLAFVRRHLPQMLQRNLSGHLFIVSENGIRIR